MTTPCRLAAMSSALFLAMSAAPAAAAESYDNCSSTIASLPATIGTPGVWCMKGDLATGIASGSAILVAANNVTIDCNGFKLGGLAAGLGTETVGILAQSRQNLVVRDCNLRGFAVGIRASDGSGHVVEDNRIDSSRQLGVEVDGAGSTVRRNIVTDTGGTTNVSIPTVIGIQVQFGADAIDNSLAGITGTIGGDVIGILGTQDFGGTIAGNRITRLAPGDGGVAFGIVDDQGGTTIKGNAMIGPGTSSGVGISCAFDTTTVTGNVMRGFALGSTGCIDSLRDIFNPN